MKLSDRHGSATLTGLSADTSSCLTISIFSLDRAKNRRPFDTWITVWKGGVARILKQPELRWQAGSFHHRIRSYEDFIGKLTYIDENRVIAGLVKQIEDWPYRGELFRLFDWWC